jgi:hypothetical protein
MRDDTRNPDLTTVLHAFFENKIDGLRVALPGRIEAYDAATQRASVQPLVKHAHFDETDTRVATSLPQIHSVPVMFLGPARGRITWPVASGDTALLVFASSSIARWLYVGGEVDPGDDRRHDINDAVAIVGLHDFAHVPTTAPTDAIVTHGLSRIGGPDATEAIVVQSALDQFTGALEAAIAALTLAAQDASQLTALQGALGAWSAGTVSSKAR